MAANTASSEVDEEYLKKLGIHAQIETFIQENDSLPDDFGTVSTPRITRSAKKLTQNSRNGQLNQRNFAKTSLNWLRSEISSLKNEINLIEEEIQAENRKLNELKAVKNSETRNEPKPKIAPETVEHLIELVKLSINITELKILKITNEDVKGSKDQTSMLRLQELEGIIRNIRFNLRIFILENLKEELVAQSHIKKLKIIIEDEDKNSELDEFLNRMERNRDIIMLFQGLLQYGKLLEERQMLFRELSDKYSHIISLPKGDTGNVMHCTVSGRDSHITYEFCCGIKMLQEGKLIPSVTLRIQDARGAQNLDKHKVLQNISSSFAEMVEEFKVQGALELFLDTLEP